MDSKQPCDAHLIPGLFAYISYDCLPRSTARSAVVSGSSAPERPAKAQRVQRFWRLLEGEHWTARLEIVVALREVLRAIT
jgi:hypothetical protein